MKNKFLKRDCFAIDIFDLLDFMRERKNNKNLVLAIAKWGSILFVDKSKDVMYDEDDVMELVGKELNVEFNYLFVEGNEFEAMVYFIERKLEN